MENNTLDFTITVTDREQLEFSASEWRCLDAIESKIDNAQEGAARTVLLKAVKAAKEGLVLSKELVDKANDKLGASQRTVKRQEETILAQKEKYNELWKLHRFVLKGLIDRNNYGQDD